jgi:hypothetical protein
MKKYFLHIILIFVLLVYVLSLVYLYYYQTIKISVILNNFTSFIGWLIALFLVYIQLLKNRDDNYKLNQEELRKNYCIKAFEKINSEITNLSETVIKIGIKYLTLPAYYSIIHKVDNKLLSDLIKEININEQLQNILKALQNFVITYEAYEIAFIDFKHYKEFIQLSIFEIEAELRFINGYLYADDNTKQNFNYEIFLNKSNVIYNKTIDLTSYLYDLRIEFMNKFMSDLFNNKIPERKPLKSGKKLLREVAIKEEVEKSFSKLESQYMNNSV